MVRWSSILLSCMTIGSLALMLRSYQGYQRQLSHQDQVNTALVHLKRTSDKQKQIVPTIKSVSNSYQKALNKAKAFNRLDMAWYHHLKPNENPLQGKFKKYYVPLKLMVEHPDQFETSQVPVQVRGIHSVVEYGGENGEGRVSMAIRYYDQHNRLMYVTSFFYDISADRLTGFQHYSTHLGLKISQNLILRVVK